MRSLFICRHLLLIVHQTQLCLLQYYLRGLSCLLCLSYKLVLSFATRQNYCLGDTDASDAAVHVAVSWMCGLLPLRLLLHFQKLLLLFTSVTWTQTHQRLPCMSPYPGCVACSFCVCSCISRNFCCCSLPLLGHRRIRCCRACCRILDVWPTPFAFAPAFLKLLLLFISVNWTQTHQMLPCMSPYPGCVACSHCVCSCISEIAAVHCRCWDTGVPNAAQYVPVSVVRSAPFCGRTAFGCS